MAYHYGRFYLEQWEIPQPQDELMANFLGVLFNTVDYANLLNNNEFEGHCIKAGFIPVFRIVRRVEEIVALRRPSHSTLSIQVWGRGSNIPTQSSPAVSYGRTINAYHREKHCTRRLRWVDD